jgi:DNA mismatch repair protein MutS
MAEHSPVKETRTSAGVNLEDATPMMRQFLEIKQQHPGVLLFYQMGEFYETFFEDALIAARALEITLTARDAGKLGKVPMAGVPIHKRDVYLPRLLGKNFRVAICEQVEDPATAKGLVKRQVTRILSPGTVMDDSQLSAKENNYLAVVVPAARLKGFSKLKGYWGLAYADLSTGELCATTLTEAQLAGELDRLNPSELLAAGRKERRHVLEGVDEWVAALPLAWQQAYRCTPLDDIVFEVSHSRPALLQLMGAATTLNGTGLPEQPLVEVAASALAHYVVSMFPHNEGEDTSLPTLQRVNTYQLDATVGLTVAARRHLELTATVKTNQYEGSLCYTLDETVTPMGGRLLRQWVSQPITDKLELNERLSAVEELTQYAATRQQLAAGLPNVYDIERLAIRLMNGSLSPRDCVALKLSLGQMPAISNALKPCRSQYLTCLHSLPQPLFTLMGLIDQAIDDAPPQQVTEGGIFKTGYHQELDELRNLATNAKQWLVDFQEQERETTGIKTLKVSHNNAFGYYIEISRAQAATAELPEHYQRKQTLTNAERFITPELKTQETRVQEAEARQLQLEYELFIQLRQQMREYAQPLMALARDVARLDVLAGFAKLAVERHYTKPILDDSQEIQLQDARHPVVEAMLPMGSFVANHCHLSSNPHHHPLVPQLMLITGPNMAGKSTYMRQVALIILMAQMGCFVPASYARIGLVDNVFTRIGAMDDLSSGQSTFMVEMQETAQILHGATNRSLVLLDEVGRGTSTSDGIAIAQSVTEHLVNHIGARTLFATHYHELNALEDQFPAIQNMRVCVADDGEAVTFLHKVEPGTAQKSYGVHVAQMAGLPSKVVNRAEKLLNRLENSMNPLPKASKSPAPNEPTPQLTIF